jgi:hypothetical protein
MRYTLPVAPETMRPYTADGTNRMFARTVAMSLFALMAGAAFYGCEESRLPVYFDAEQSSASSATAAVAFDPATAGSIAGRVTWEGAVPQVPPFRAPVSPLSEQPIGPKLLWPNPHAPVVDVKSGGIAGAVVFLRGVDPARSRPWNYAPVCVAVRDCRFHVLQGDSDTLTGFVHRGDNVTIVSEDDRFQSVQARGAAFFTLTLPDRDCPHERVLDQTGVVELSSNAGQFWMRAHLFVADHPYLTRTDAQGHFSLEGVPPGDYEIGCWLPDWHEATHERDGETALYSRMTFRPSVVKLRDVSVGRLAWQRVDFAYGAGDFGH